MLTSSSAQLFYFDEDTTYLDHGGYGATPREVMSAYIEECQKVEEAPRPFFEFDFYNTWQQHAAMVAQRFSAQAEDLALTNNATDGLNAVLRSTPLQSDDEILITSWTYGAIANAARYMARRQGARVIEAPFHYPNPNPEQCLEALKAAITPRTKIAIVDHITSATALVLPIEKMVQLCHEYNVAVLVDGAHVPGQLSLDLQTIHADWYVANLHKWYFVPRGCGFLWAGKQRQIELVPSVLSWDIEKPFPHSFEWIGTRDPSTWLSIPAAFNFMDHLGENNVRQHNHTLIKEGAALLAKAWHISSTTPASMTGSMILVPLPADINFPATDEGRRKLQMLLWNSYKIACPCILYGNKLYIRISAQIYNKAADYEKLAQAISAIKKA